MPLSGDYARYGRALAGAALPAALVDLDALDRNVDHLLAPVRAGRKRLRVASKSLRAPELLRRVLDRAGDHAGGVLAYAAREAAFLVGLGFRDVVVAYPSLDPHDLQALAELAAAGSPVAIVVDDPQQASALGEVARARHVVAPVLIDVDVSYRPFGGRLHLGVRRSPIRTVAAAVALAEVVSATPGVALRGIMAYEAHVAGLPDRGRHARWLNGPKRLLKHLARRPLERLRAELAAAFRARGLPLEIFNGGGTGSLGWCSAEPDLTEVTAGSGVLAGHLFDGYRDLTLEPALGFALQVVRRPDPGRVTCHGGGYVASGEVGPDRLPMPWLPAGARLLGLEGAGEVMTPVELPRGVELPLGAPVFFRHAKSGELAEHFAEYLLVRGDRVVGRAPTYRGLGQCFLG